MELHVEDAVKNTAAPAVEKTPEPASHDKTAAARDTDTDTVPDSASAAAPAAETAPGDTAAPAKTPETSGDFERGKIAGLQEAIIAIMEKNGPVTDQMRKDVTDNVYHDSLVNWIKSFR